MNIQEYISSGILECYVLGQLTQEENRQVEALAAEHAEIRQEIKAIEDSLEGYAKSFAKTPPPSLKAEIFDKIETWEVKDSDTNKDNDTKVISIQNHSSFKNYLVAASVTIALISSVLAVFFWQKWQSAENRVFALEQENSSIAGNFNQVKQILEERNSVIAAITDQNTEQVELKGLPISPGSKALVFWNKSSKELYINPLSLPEPPKDMQYQLWALQDGKPVDAGVFDLETAIQRMKEISSAQAFAVTLEKKGGSPTPTLDKMYLMGQI